MSLPTAILLTAALGLGLPALAHAHRLEAEYRVLPDGRFQVECWFDLTGDSPPGAKVVVFRQDGQLVTEGTVDDKGLFTFRLENPQPLRVVVSAGAGHRKELSIPKYPTLQDAPPGPGRVEPTSNASDSPFADRSTRVSARDVVAGLGFLLALSAFIMSLRNGRRIREMSGDGR